MFWNVRAMPRLVTALGFKPTRFLPLNMTSPSVGAYKPVTTLKAVVFPRAVRADEAEHLALVHYQVQRIERHHAAETPRELLQHQKTHYRAHFPAPALS